MTTMDVKYLSIALDFLCALTNFATFLYIRQTFDCKKSLYAILAMDTFVVTLGKYCFKKLKVPAFKFKKIHSSQYPPRHFDVSKGNFH